MKAHFFLRLVFVAAAALFCVMPFHALYAGQDSQPERVVNESNLYYTVKKGDTLWSISKRFADTPWLWPDLWQKNGQITNPHRIFPGEKIRLYHNQGADTPAVTTSPAPVPAKPVMAAAPPPPPPMPYYLYSTIDQVGFLRQPPMAPAGRIFNSSDDKYLISTGDNVYVKAAQGSELTVGQRYTIYRTMPISGHMAFKNTHGSQHYILGLAEITEKKPEYAVAVVRRSYRAIRPNDLLVPYAPRSPRITLVPSPPGMTGKIIVSEEHQSFFGSDNIAFIDKGADNGIRVGQKYKVFYQQKIKGADKTDIIRHPVDYATLLVLLTETDTASVLVLSAEKSIPPGAPFHSPK